MTQPQLSVMVMAYNEALSLRTTCGELLDSLRRVGVVHELVIIDDGSTDGTGAIADAWAKDHPTVRVIRHESNRGLGGVYRTGFQEALGQYLTFFPADGQFPATIIEDFLPRMSRVDAVLGYLPNRTGGAGALLSAIERAAYRSLLGPMPRFQGIMMLKRDLLHATPLLSQGRGWAIVMELLLKLHQSGASTESVPTGIRPRAHGASKVNNWRTILANFRQLLVLRRQLRGVVTR